MSLLTQFNVSHNLESDTEAESLLEKLVDIIDSQPTIDQLLESPCNWDKVSGYISHPHSVFLDNEHLDDSYSHFIEGDITGMPDSMSLEKDESGSYCLSISHRKKNERSGGKRFVFTPSLDLTERVESYEHGIMSPGINGDSVSVTISGENITDVRAYDSSTGKAKVNKQSPFSVRRSENAELLRVGWLSPSESFVDYCRSMSGSEPTSSDMAEIAKLEGLDGSDIDFKSSRAYIEDNTLKIRKVTPSDRDMIISYLNGLSNTYIQLDNQDLGIDKPKLGERLKRLFTKRSVSKDYNLDSKSCVSFSGDSSAKAASGSLMEGSIHQVIHSDMTFDDIGGQEYAKGLAKDLVNQMKNRKRFSRMGLADFSFIIGLYGPPGTGKTLLAKIMAHEAGKQGRPLLAVASSALDEQLVGVGSGRVRSLFDHARQVNGIIFIDEIDSIGMPRTSGVNAESAKTLNTTLTEIEGVKGTGVDVIWATNVPFDRLDNALLSRTMYRITMDNPDFAGRQEIFGIHTRSKRLSYSAYSKLDYYAHLLEGDGSGRLIKNMMNSAVRLAGISGDRLITPDSLQAAFESALFGSDGAGKRELSGKIMEVTAYHEAGHAIAAYYLFEKGSVPFERYVNMISIKPMGDAAGFVYTRNFDRSSECLMREDYINTLSVGLAGRVSEELRYNTVSPGARNDLEKVDRVSEELILGGVSLDGRLYFDKKSPEFKSAKLELVYKAHENAVSVLNAYPEKVKAVADALIDEKVIYRDRFIGLVENS